MISYLSRKIAIDKYIRDLCSRNIGQEADCMFEPDILHVQCQNPLCENTFSISALKLGQEELPEGPNIKRIACPACYCDFDIDTKKPFKRSLI